jgi:hypothetical protein
MRNQFRAFGFKCNLYRYNEGLRALVECPAPCVCIVAKAWVGLYKLNAVDRLLDSVCFQPFNLSSENPVSNIAFKFNLSHYTWGEQCERVLGVTLEENVAMIEESAGAYNRLLYKPQLSFISCLTIVHFICLNEAVYLLIPLKKPNHLNTSAEPPFKR